jgi:hypothetical protein
MRLTSRGLELNQKNNQMQNLSHGLLIEGIVMQLRAVSRFLSYGKIELNCIY